MVNDRSSMLFSFEVHDRTALDLFAECEKSLQRFGKTELIEKSDRAYGRSLPAGYLTIQAPDGRISRYACEAKRRVGSSALAQIASQLENWETAYGGKPLLLTTHANDALGDQLRARGIAYLDEVGNACIMADPLVHICVRGFKPFKRPERATRAFQATGLQLIALLLGHPEAIEWTYRKIAEFAGLSLGSVSRVLSDLRSLGFISLVAPGRNAVVNRRRLFEHWEFGYSTRLRPRLRPLTYRQADGAKVEGIPRQIPPAAREGTLIGGELAAAIATKHLRTQSITLHVWPNVPILSIVKELTLVADPNGNIAIIRQFGNMSAWKWEGHEKEFLIHPLLIHAELLHGKPDDRLLETARLIYDAHIAPTLDNEPSTHSG
jgi:hypothetical protein